MSTLHYRRSCYSISLSSKVVECVLSLKKSVTDLALNSSSLMQFAIRMWTDLNKMIRKVLKESLMTSKWDWHLNISEERLRQLPQLSPQTLSWAFSLSSNHLSNRIAALHYQPKQWQISRFLHFAQARSMWRKVNTLCLRMWRLCKSTIGLQSIL